MKNINIRKSLSLFIALFSSLLVIAQNAESNKDLIVLENDKLVVSFNKEFGTLEYMKYKETGWKVETREELAQSFKIYIPTTERRDNLILGSSHSLYQYKKEDNRITFIWKNLNSTTVNDLDVTFTGIVTLTDDGLEFTANCNNNSKYNIEAIYWPYFGDFRVPDKKEYTQWQSFNYNGRSRSHSISPGFSSHMGYYGVDYPIQMHNTQYSHFGVIQAENQGIYVGYHDTTDVHRVDFTFELRPGWEQNISEWMQYGSVPMSDSINNQPVHYEFSCIHFPYINANESAQLKPIIINPYKGDWQAGADYYKTWRNTWTNNLPLPKWTEEVHSWQQIHINSSEDRPVFNYKDLVNYCDECAENDVKAIQLTGWTNGGQDRGNPSHDIDPRLGTWNDLKTSISECQKMGVKIILFNKYTWADESQDWFKNELINYAVKDPYGNYGWHQGYKYQTPMQLADINTRRLIPLCHHSDDWRKIAITEFEKSIDLGADGMLFDENQHHGNYFYCFDKTHGHHVPANVFAGDITLEDDFWSVIRRKKPDYLLVGESNRDLQFKSYHMTYFRIGSDYNGMHRYVAPKQKMQAAVVGHNDRHTLNEALLFNLIISYEPRNFKGKLSEYPLTLEYGKLIDNLRRKYKDYLWDGVYHDVIGATVKSGKDKFNNYSVFINEKNGKKAVVLINPNVTGEISLDVIIEGGKGNFVIVCPENLKEQQFDGKTALKPLSAVVIIEK